MKAQISQIAKRDFTIAFDIVAWAEKVAEIEETIAAKLRDGETREAAFAAHPRFAHIRRLREQA